jgi:tetratricopeptide (TPR) repeat protein
MPRVIARCSSRRAGILLCCAAGLCAQDSQKTTPTVRHHPVAVEEKSASSALLDKAESLLAKGEYPAAEPILLQATAKDPASYQGWYDLGYVEQALNHNSEAIAAYRKSVDINPKIFETNLNLGLSLAAVNQRDEAIKYLKAATQLQPSSRAEQAKQHAWLALGQLQISTDPVASEQAFTESAKLVPTDSKPHLLLADLYDNLGKLEDARSQYQDALAEAQGEDRALALRGLVNIAIASKQYAAAESNIRQYLATTPNDQQAHLLLGRLLAAQGKDEDALAELNSAGSESNPPVLHEKAQLLAAVHREAEAVPLYQKLIEQNQNDAQLRYEYGLALMHQLQFPAAQEQLLAAIKLNPNLASAYGDLAVAASDNQQYDLALKALDIRTKLLGDNPGTYFLRATALDHLRRFPEATQNYRQFLAAANGKYPDEEWKARHRLIAIQNLK